jgi:glycosyltransferase involved in cell wall biosynthesis
MENDDIIVSIGLPVYNGEKFLKKRIDNILNQTHQNIELIISDNHSNDRTSEICKRYESKDIRIKYYFQEKQIPITKNFGFVLAKSTGKYFAWASIDDILESTFIEKNLRILEKNNKIVCSAGQVESFGEKTNFLKKNKSKSKILGWWKKIIQKNARIKNISTSGSYEENVRLFLKLKGYQQIFYGLFRTNQLKKMMVYNLTYTFDWAILLNGLKFGNYYVIDEILMYRYDGGISSGGLFNVRKKLNLNLINTIFMNGKFILWCWKNLGKKIFLKNLDCFVRAIFDGFIYLGIDSLRWFRKKLFKN